MKLWYGLLLVALVVSCSSHNQQVLQNQNEVAVQETFPCWYPINKCGDETPGWFYASVQVPFLSGDSADAKLAAEVSIREKLLGVVSTEIESVQKMNKECASGTSMKTECREDYQAMVLGTVSGCLKPTHWEDLEFECGSKVCFKRAKIKRSLAKIWIENLEKIKLTGRCPS